MLVRRPALSHGQWPDILLSSALINHNGEGKDLRKTMEISSIGAEIIVTPNGRRSENSGNWDLSDI